MRSGWRTAKRLSPVKSSISMPQKRVDDMTTQLVQVRLNTPVYSMYGRFNEADDFRVWYSSNLILPTRPRHTILLGIFNFGCTCVTEHQSACVWAFDAKERYQGQGYNIWAWRLRKALGACDRDWHWNIQPQLDQILRDYVNDSINGPATSYVLSRQLR